MSMRSLTSAVLWTVLTLIGAGEAMAGPMTVTFEAAGVMTPNAATVCGTTAGCTVGYETFS